ncbi:NADH-quinone oxidoreductase subunit NuoE [Buchananella hordeovulneris]|uniref:NADH-quinone oxidoreductase subunit NuoE n=1 Tax=Buchananella hordeovulneris TaxID=52770 RepID=UPI0026DAAB1A|nr:NADH-quinone oxidoreductase subunit NuoE [Buchananella hordeovulneris]MDO5081027.1 NADH-quinone oxidoreductase subunit NuoE [Buchananella hordeovulneris]
MSQSWSADVEAQFRADAAEIIARYPAGYERSALLPMLHLVQSVDSYVSPVGITLVAEILGLTRAEVSAVATFYTQYRRHPSGEYHVGVCTNSLCAVLGGDAIWEAVSAHLDLGHDETSADRKLSLERLECNAACDYAPVVMVNWEFFDNQSVDSALQLVDDLAAGKEVAPTRGPDKLPTFREVSRTLAGFEDGLAGQGPGAGEASLRGLEIARAQGWSAPQPIEEEQ